MNEVMNDSASFDYNNEGEELVNQGPTLGFDLVDDD
jgi:hypothetical protein